MMKPLRLAFWEGHPPYAPSAGGISSYIQHRAHVLGPLGVEIWWANGTAAARWSVADQDWVERRAFKVSRFRGRLLGRWPALSPVWRFLAEEKEVELFEFLAGLNSWLPHSHHGPQVVLQCHTSTQTRAFLNGDHDVERRMNRFKWWANRNLRQAAGIVACSSEIAMLEAGLFHVHPDRITILPHAFSRHAEAGLTVRNESGGNGGILVVGNLEYFKGMDLVARGFDEYYKQGGKGRLQIAGCGGLHELLQSKSARGTIKPILEKLMAEHGAEKVQFLGRLDKGELARHRAAATAILCGSRFEALTMVAGEAFLTGCPLILSNRTGWHALAARYGAARLFNPYDARDTAAALLEMENPAARQKYQRGGDDLAAYLQSVELAAQTADFYRNSLAVAIG